MSVYVGIDVHRKRSQVAVIDAKGEVLANRNVPNGVEPILKVIGGPPPGAPAAVAGGVGAGGWGGCRGDKGFVPPPGAPRRGRRAARPGRRKERGERAGFGERLQA